MSLYTYKQSFFVKFFYIMNELYVEQKYAIVLNISVMALFSLSNNKALIIHNNTGNLQLYDQSL